MKTIDELNDIYRSLSPGERVKQVFADFDRVLFTSSFGTTAAILLHMFRKINPELPVYFLDTTYHFGETIEYKKQLTELLDLNVIDIRPEEWKNKFTQEDHTWQKDPDLCCSINKVEPLEKIRPQFDVWVSGLMSMQTSHRSQLRIFTQGDGIIKFHPLLDMSREASEKYFEEHGLPRHPLQAHGFNSVGCFHCTVKGKGREGRWANKSKSECGLHL